MASTKGICLLGLYAPIAIDIEPDQGQDAQQLACHALEQSTIAFASSLLMAMVQRRFVAVTLPRVGSAPRLGSHGVQVTVCSVEADATEELKEFKVHATIGQEHMQRVVLVRSGWQDVSSQRHGCQQACRYHNTTIAATAATTTTTKSDRKIADAIAIGRSLMQ